MGQALTTINADQLGDRLLQERLAGCKDKDIAARHGLTEQAVQEMILGRVKDLLVNKRVAGFQAHGLDQLLQIDLELAEMDAALELDSQRWYQAQDKEGGVVELWEHVSNVPAKIKIKSERRMNILARKVVMGIEGNAEGDGKDGADKKMIVDTLKDVVSDVFGNLVEELADKSEEIGRLRAEAPPIDLTPIDVASADVPAGPADEETQDE